MLKSCKKIALPDEKKKEHRKHLFFFHKLLLPPIQKPDKIMMDNSKEFVKAWKDLQWNHDTSTPHRSETNGVAERTFRRVKEGPTVALVQIVESSDRPIIPFGSVEYLLNSAKDKSKTHQCGREHCKGSRQGLCTTGQFGHHWQIAEIRKNWKRRRFSSKDPKARRSLLKHPYDLPCAGGTSKPPDSHCILSCAEGDGRSC